MASACAGKQVRFGQSNLLDATLSLAHLLMRHQPLAHFMDANGHRELGASHSEGLLKAGSRPLSESLF